MALRAIEGPKKRTFCGLKYRGKGDRAGHYLIGILFPKLLYTIRRLFFCMHCLSVNIFRRRTRHANSAKFRIARTQNLSHAFPFLGRILLGLELFQPFLGLFIVHHGGQARCEWG